MIPDKPLFIVTSSLKPAMGVFKDDERFSQTVASLKSIRSKVPEAIILFADVSVRPVSDLERETLAGLSNYYLDLSEEPNTRYCAVNGLKSHGENCLLLATLVTLKQDKHLSKLMSSVNRIFKFSARSELEDTFDINDYKDTFGKFVFKKRIPTWTGDVKFGADHLLITRMWSMCPSLIDTYLSVIQENLRMLSNGIADTEHAHYVNIPKDYLLEFDKINCWGWLAGNGQIEHY